MPGRQMASAGTDLASAARFLRHQAELTEPPSRAPAGAPPYCQSKTVRRHGQSEQSSQLGAGSSANLYYETLHDPAAKSRVPRNGAHRCGGFIEPRCHHSTLGRARKRHRALDGVRARRPLRCPGSPRAPGTGHTKVLSRGLRTMKTIEKGRASPEQPGRDAYPHPRSGFDTCGGGVLPNVCGCAPHPLT